MKIGIYGNPEKTRKEQATKEVQSFLVKNGFETTEFTNAEDVKSVDVLLVLGGDGTILRTVESCVKNAVKVVGINYGTVGFLSEIEKDDKEGLLRLLSDVKTGKAKYLHRTVLEICVGGKTYYALNEIALRRNYESDDSAMLKTDVYTDDKFYDTLSGDGVLVCTPTGSTAYSLSAGGPILDPETPALVLTPLCAFSLRARPVVFPDTHTVKIQVEKGTAFWLVDGVKTVVLNENENVTIKKSVLTMDFAVNSDYCFYERLNKKLR